jgi:hypothetical protein
VRTSQDPTLSDRPAAESAGASERGLTGGPSIGRRLGRPRPNGAAPPAQSIDRWLLLVAGLALIAVIVTNWLSLKLNHLSYTLLNANWEFSWSHDADTLALAVGACVAISVALRPTVHRRLWALTAAILALFVLVEISSLHARIGAVSFNKLLYAPILVALVVAVWRLTAETPQRRLAVWGIATLLVSFAMHVVGLHLLRPIGYFTWLYQTGVGFKSGTELAGLILLVSALWQLARRERSQPSLS